MDDQAQLLTLLLRPALEFACVEILLEHAAVSGFTTMPCRGHGVHPDGLTTAEQVSGSRGELRIDVALDAGAAREVLAELSARLPRADIHYWLTPLLATGRIGDA